MRKGLCFLLMFTLVLGGILLPQSAWAGHGNAKKQVAPGLAKKIDLKDLELQYDKNLKITRAQFASLIAQKDADFKNFKENKEIRGKINDWKAIPEKDREAVSYVISKEYLRGLYQNLPNGKIVFQPNKPVTFREFLLYVNNCQDQQEEETVEEIEGVTYQGTVRMVDKIGEKTWIVVKNNEGLCSAYFTAKNLPEGLKTGIEIKIRIDDTDHRIITSSLKEQESKNLLTANQSSVEQNLTGFSPSGFNTYAGATLRKSTAEKWQGNNSLQVTTTGYNAWQGVNVVYQEAEITGPTTFSFYVKATDGTPLRVVVYDQANANYPSGAVLEFKASGKWERKVVTFTPTKASNDLALQITLNNSDQPAVFYLDGLQLENGNKATTWVLGD